MRLLKTLAVAALFLITGTSHALEECILCTNSTTHNERKPPLTMRQGRHLLCGKPASQYIETHHLQCAIPPLVM